MYIARIIFDESHFFDTWRAYTKWSLEEKENDDSQWLWKYKKSTDQAARKRAYEIKHAAKVEKNKMKEFMINSRISAKSANLKMSSGLMSGQMDSVRVVFGGNTIRWGKATKESESRRCTLLVPKRRKPFGALKGKANRKQQSLHGQFDENFAKTEDQQWQNSKKHKNFERDQTECIDDKKQQLLTKLKFDEILRKSDFILP